jgi:hypothetical protein
VSPNPVTGAAAWTLAIAVDVIGVVAAAVVLGWDRWCPAGTTGCPTVTARSGRDSLVVVVLGCLLLVVAVLAMLTGRLLLAVVQVGLVVLLVVGVRQGLPEVWGHVRTHQFGAVGISAGMPRG